MKGRIDQTRVFMGLARGVKIFNSAKTERATIELSFNDEDRERRTEN